MSSYELAEIIVAKKIKSYTKLLAFAREQKLEGKTDVAEFVLNRGSKVIAEFLQTAWDMENSQETLQRQKKSHLQLLYDFLHQECVNSVLKDNVIYFLWSFTRLLVATRQKSSKPRIRKV